MSDYPRLIDQIETRRSGKARIVTQLHQTGPATWTVTRGVSSTLPGSGSADPPYDTEQAAREAFSRRPRGRTPRGGQASVTFTLRALQSEIDAWHEAASSDGIATRDFVRTAATRAAAATSMRRKR